MSKSRVEAFTDAVIAIIMTLLILDIATPSGDSFRDIWALRYKLLVYLISFISLGIYWNNHHHLLQLTKQVNGSILWLNMAFIFFLSLFPFATSWVDEFPFSIAPEMLYGLVVLGADIAFTIMQKLLVRANQAYTETAALNNFKKHYFTIGLVGGGILLGLIVPVAVLVCCTVSLLFWVLPYRSIEKKFK